MHLADFQGPPCRCGECVQAGVTELPQRRDPDTGCWLHGYALKRWYEARDEFRRRARSAVGPRGRRGAGFERLVREPGEEG